MEELVQAEWPHHEADRHLLVQSRPASPPCWQTELDGPYPDMGPSDPVFARQNPNRPRNAMDWDAEEELEECNQTLASMPVRPKYGEGSLVEREGCDDVPEPVMELLSRSEMRTPLLLPWTADGLGSESEALAGVTVAAATRSTEANPRVLNSPSDSDAAVELVERCLSVGTWAVLIQRGDPDPALYRRLALLLMTVTPDPSKFPLRERFRLWVVVELPVDLYRLDVFPAVFTHQLLQLTTGGQSKHKVVKKLGTDPAVRERELARRAERKERGDADEDAESLPGDEAEAGRKFTGAWFVRSAELEDANDRKRHKERLDLPSKVVFRRRHLASLTRVHA